MHSYSPFFLFLRNKCRLSKMAYSNISPTEITELSTGSEKSLDSIIGPYSDFGHQSSVGKLWFHEWYKIIGGF